MIVVTSEQIAHKRIVKTLGVVRGSTVRASHMGRDILAMLRNLVGGEVEEYTKMLAEAREQALDRMMYDAQRIGANAIVASRFITASLHGNLSEVVVFGTAVIVEEDGATLAENAEPAVNLKEA